jgi:quinoprotein glucose dehydrogenase
MGQPDRKGEPPEGETYTPSTPNSWAPMSADETLGMVFVPMGNPTPDHYGGQRRPFDEKYSSSIVALDAETGDVRWSFQTVHHDVWDLDVASQPSLVDIPTAAGMVPGVVAPTKQGELYVLNRLTGEPIFPVKEMPVPTDNGAPGDRYAPTQPQSVGVPSFRGPMLTEGSMWGITPLDQLWCRVKFREARYDSPFPPPSEKRPIIGLIDVMDWGSAAVDTSRHMAIVDSGMIPNYTLLISRAEADARGIKVSKDLYRFRVGQKDAQGGTPVALINGRFLSPLDVPCPQPPYGRLSAVDLKTGKLIWTRVFGSAKALGPLGVPSHLPITLGTYVTGGAVVTQSGLTFIAATQDRTLRAFDTTTGKMLWHTGLPGGGSATPITYISPESGRQFVAISVSGNDGIIKSDGDYIVAFALPKSGGE